MKLPPLNAIRAFEAAARAGTFVAAASELGVSAAAVSMQVRNLEVYLNKKLFVRSNNRITLTDAGQTMYPQTAAALNGIAAMTERVLESDVRSLLVISIMPSLAERWLAPRLADFRRTNPGIGVEVRLEDDPVDFARFEIDMRITFGSHLYPAFRSVALFQDDVTPLCAPDFAPLFEEGNPSVHLQDEHLIHVEWGVEFASNPSWNDWFRQAGANRQPKISNGVKVSAPSFAIALAANGLGIALGQTLLAKSELASGTLVAPSPHALTLARPYYAITAHAQSSNHNLNCLIDSLSNGLCPDRAFDLR